MNRILYEFPRNLILFVSSSCNKQAYEIKGCSFWKLGYQSYVQIMKLTRKRGADISLVSERLKYQDGRYVAKIDSHRDVLSPLIEHRTYFILPTIDRPCKARGVKLTRLRGTRWKGSMSKPRIKRAWRSMSLSPRALPHYPIFVSLIIASRRTASH